MNIVLGGMLVCALLIALGLFFRWACLLFSVALLYIFLLDKSLYNNHIYLFVILGFLLSFTDADKFFSLKRVATRPFAVPRWQPGILQLQFIIVYFYGGIAKLKADWLIRAEPVRSLVASLDTDNPFLKLFASEAGVLFINFGGLLVDLGAPLFLLYKPTRKWAIWIYVAFNFINSRLFNDIGIFPYVMLCSLLLFTEPETWRLPEGLRRLLRLDRWSADVTAPVKTWATEARFAQRILIPFVAFQLLFPFRGFFLPNPMDWTTIGNRFSWRMKVDTRHVEEIGFYVQDRRTMEFLPLRIETMINSAQLMHLSTDPRSIVQFGRYLRDYGISKGIPDPLVKGHVLVQYNGRRLQNFFDPETDLAAAQIRFYARAPWVQPLAE
jgi:hypothetical protein